MRYLGRVNAVSRVYALSTSKSRHLASRVFSNLWSSFLSGRYENKTTPANAAMASAAALKHACAARTRRAFAFRADVRFAKIRGHWASCWEYTDSMISSLLAASLFCGASNLRMLCATMSPRKAARAGRTSSAHRERTIAPVARARTAAAAMTARTPTRTLSSANAFWATNPSVAATSAPAAVAVPCALVSTE